MPAGVLFVHNNFPAQFRHLAEALLARGVPCWAVGAYTSPGVQGVRIRRYNLPRGTTPGIFNLAVRAEADLIRGRMALEGARSLKAEEGIDPAVIIGHPGWGETVLMDEAFPAAKQVLFSEFFYHGRDLDIDFDNEFFPLTDLAVLLGKTKNAVMALSLSDADVIVTPTAFQASVLPPVFRPLVKIIHEGVDTKTIRPGEAAPFELDDGRVIAPGTPVITHINNQMEPLRGLHIFARALPRLLAEVPNARVIVIGQEGNRGYGGNAPDERTWKDVCFEGVEVDPARVHFLGKVPHARMLAALRLSTAHIYYSYPFVLSWSLTEAMASGCYIIGSDTAPLRDAIEDGVNGRLLPFFDVDALSTAMIDACRNPDAQGAMRDAARRTAVAHFDRDAGLKAWFDVLRDVGLEIP